MNSLHQNANPDVEPFESRIDILFRELELAIKWQRPSTLFAVYSSDYVRAEAEAALANRISGLGHRVFHLQLLPNSATSCLASLPFSSEPEQTVLFVRTPPHGAGESGPEEFEAVNRSRDYLTEKDLRVVFWLREPEAIEIAQRAPDSWALRHRVVEFVDSPMSQEIIQCALDGARHNSPQCAISPDEIDARVELGEALLNELPDQDQGTAVYAKLLLTLGILAWRKGDSDKSARYIATAQDIARIHSDGRLEAECLITLGHLHAGRGEPDRAIEAFEKAMELAPDHETLPRDLGLLYARTGKLDQAIEAFLISISRAPEDAPSWKGLGDAYSAQGRDDSALAAYQKALSLSPHLAEAWVRLGHLYAAADRLDEATQAFREGLAGDPQNAGAWLALGETLLKQHQTEAALTAFARLAEIEGARSSHPETQDPPKSTDADLICEGICEDPPDDLSSLEVEGWLEPMDEEVHFSLGQYEKAECLACAASLPNGEGESSATPVPESAPAEPSAEDVGGLDAKSWNETGHARLDAGEYDAAIAAYIRAIELSHGSNWSYINSLTRAYYLKGQGPQEGSAGNAQASACGWAATQPRSAQEGTVAEPETAHESLPDQIPASPEAEAEPAPSNREVLADAAIIARMRRARLHRTPQHDEINFRERAVRPALSARALPKGYTAADFDPKLLADAAHEDQRYGLRRSYRYLAEDDEIPARQAGAASRKPSQVDSPDEAVVAPGTQPARQDRTPVTAQEWLEQGNIMLRSGLYDEAIVCYNRSLDLAPRSGGTYSNLALAYCYKEQYAEALPLYQKSIYLLKSNKEKAISWNRLGDAYRRLHDQTSAAAAYRNAAQLYPGTNTLRTRARAALLSNAIGQ